MPVADDFSHRLLRRSGDRVHAARADDAWEKIINGASLVQIYSAMVFEGAGVIKKIVNGLERKLKQAGLDSLDQAVGLARRK